MNPFRKILFPISWLYGAVVFLRNKLFDSGFFSSKSYAFPVICIGNLSTGGTGKSPMVEHLISLLKNKKDIAVLSRGYKRKTKGFQLLTGKETAQEVGDEPLQFKTKFPEITVAVDEDRQHGIYRLQKLENPPDVVLLDDAFQHRKVRAGLNILLTVYGDLYCDDFLLPAGNLREPRSGAKRADLVVVTKCPRNLSQEEMYRAAQKLRLKKSQQLYFSTISYSSEAFSEKVKKKLTDFGKFTLITGIANPKPLVEYLKSQKLDFGHLSFPDHHNFSKKELKKIAGQKTILATEKDYMRLKKHIPGDKLFYLPIQVKIIDVSDGFDRKILDFIENQGAVGTES